MLNSLNVKRNTPDELVEHVLDTYWTLRIGIILIAIAFPFWLWFGGKLIYDLERQPSMSDYYHASNSESFQQCQQLFRRLSDKTVPAEERARLNTESGKCSSSENYGRGNMRNWFVGLLFGVGVFLYLYKGFSTIENYALNLAGLFAIMIAVNPMNLWEATPAGSRHGFFAVAFFLSIAFVAAVCGRDTLHLIPDEGDRKRYAKTYIGLGALMGILPLITWAVTVVTKNGSKVFFLEMAGIVAFALYWIVKTFELKRTAAVVRAVQGELEVTDGKVVPVTKGRRP
jgi:hypothetical protein